MKAVKPIHAMLAGGDRRSTGRADELSADMLEKISAQRPGCLRPFKRDFLARLPGIVQAEVRWHAAQMLPRSGLTAAERRNRAVPVLPGYLRDKSRLVQTFASQALADFARTDWPLHAPVLALIEDAARTGSPAVRARCRQLLPPLSDP